MSVKVTVTENDRKTAREQLIKNSEEYLREVEEAYEEGFRPHYCFHGTNLWTDYDPICGYCEESSYDPRYYSQDSQEFNDVVEIMASSIARNNRFEAILEMIRDDAKDASTPSDLRQMKIKIDYLLEMEN